MGKAPAAGGVSGAMQAADSGELQPSTGTASQAAGDGQQQTQQQAALSGMAAPSRWLSEQGYNTLKWQVCSIYSCCLLTSSCSCLPFRKNFAHRIACCMPTCAR